MNAEQYRETIELAIAGEIEAKEFYLDVSKKIKDDYLRELFQEFSEEEGRHELLLKDLLEKGKIAPSTFDGSEDYEVAETIELPEVTPDMDLKAAIGLAMKSEEMAMKKYQGLANSCNDADLKVVFENLSAMETDHKVKMEDMYVNMAFPEVW